MSEIECFSKEYAKTLDVYLNQHSELDRVKQRILEDDVRPLRRWPVIAWAATVAAFAVAVLFITLRSDPISFTVGIKETPRSAGEWIAADNKTPLPLNFSDGSKIVLYGNTEARVDDLSSDHVRIRIERGLAMFSVKHREKSRWKIDAGPFQVRVVGTRFQVAWCPEKREFSISLLKGEVIVEGTALAAQRVLAGQTLRVWSETGRVELSPIDHKKNESIADKELDAASNSLKKGASSQEASKKNIESSDVISARKKSKKSARLSWRELTENARYSEALIAAEQQDWSALLINLGAKDLFSLAETARLAGHPEKARGAYKRLRSRFAQNVFAADSAFMLGRILYKKQDNPSVAAKWFETYLSEQPRGRYSREAAGRKIEAHRQAGNNTAARTAAEKYLERYPDGSYSNLARDVLEQRATP